MNIHRHAAAIVGDLQGAVFIERDVDFLAVAAQCLIDAVVDDFVRKMVRARGVGEHPRTATHGFEAA